MSFKHIFDLFNHKIESESVIGRTGKVSVILAGALLIVFPIIAQSVEEFWMNLVTKIMVFALFALSLDFVFGFTGLPSFGHAAMFGLGGYTAGLLLSEGTGSAFLVLPLAFIVGFFVAMGMGWLSVRGRGIYFAILTLASAQLIYLAVFNELPAYLLGSAELLGGDNGLIGIQTYTLFGYNMGSLINYYYLTFVVFAMSFVIIIRLADSSFGRVLRGIRENEDRMKFMGYNVRRYKIIVFAISGGFAAVAGALLVPLISVAQPGLLHWQMSGEVLIMVLLGGMGSLWGPMLAAGLILILEDVLSFLPSWQLFLATLYIIVVIFAPQGIAGMVRSLREAPFETPHRIRDALASYVSKIRR